MSVSERASPSQVAAVKAYIFKTIAAIVGMGLIFNAAAMVWLPRSKVFAAVKSYVAGSSYISNTIGPVTSINPSLFGWTIYTIGDDGEATLPVVIHGTRTTRRAVATVRRHQGMWTVSQLALK